MPKVAISKVVPSWLTKRRSTKRSINQATMNIMPPASTKAIRLTNTGWVKPVICGNHSAKRAIAKAANNTIAPWAKLNTPEAL